MALYEDPELNNDNEEGTSGGDNPSFGGSIGQTVVKEVKRELVHEAFGFIRDLFFGGDDDDD